MARQTTGQRDAAESAAEESERPAGVDELWSAVRIDPVEIALPKGVGYTLRAYRPVTEVTPTDISEREEDAFPERARPASEDEPGDEYDEEDDEDEDDDETEEAETDERAEHAAPVEESDDHLLRRMPSLTPQREAAAELTAANRPEAESVFAPPSPEPAPQPEPAPVASTQTVPVAAVPEPMSAPAPAPIATLPAGASRWDRSEDDILPEKQSKKFFSFSLRRG